MNTYEALTRSTTGRYSVAQVELTSGDVIEWLNDDAPKRGRVEHTDRVGYCVQVEAGYMPLSELTVARYIGRGTLGV